MDPAKSAHAENVEIVRDRVHIILTDGTIQFAQPANGVVFGALFHGNGRVQADPPNPIEAQQLFLFTKQPKLDNTLRVFQNYFGPYPYKQIAGGASSPRKQTGVLTKT